MDVGPSASIIDSDNARLMKLGAYASIGVATTLILIKVTAWLMTNSISLLSSLVDSLMDMLASTITLLSIGYAVKPADKEHRFGHGKMEALGSLTQAAIISGSAVFLCLESIERFVHPAQIRNGRVGIAVMLISILLTLGLVGFQRHVVRRTGSLAVDSDKLHYLGDLLMNASVIVSLLLSQWLGWTWIDPVFGMLIAIFILSSVYNIGRNALNMLMDREFPDEERKKILNIIEGFGEVIGVHDLRTRSSGPISFIQFHLELDGNLKLEQAHAISDRVMHAVEADFPNSEVLVHQDPVQDK